MKLHDYEHSFKGLWSCDSICRIRIYEGCGEQAGMTIVLATELSKNEGTSLTNWAEHLATEVSRTHEITPNRLLWIEHYEDRGCFMGEHPQFKEHFDRVTFELNQRGEFIHPKWIRFKKETIERWIGEPVGTPDREPWDRTSAMMEEGTVHP